MTYFQIVPESLRILRTTKLVWILGFLVYLASLPEFFSQAVRGNFFLICIYLAASLGALLVSLLAASGLIDLAHQRALNANFTFSEIWRRSWASLSRLIGFSALVIPVALLVLSLYLIFAYIAPTSPLLWLIILIVGTFVGSIFFFGFCAIIIHEVKIVEAAWTSFLITLNNFIPLTVIVALFFLIRWLLIGLVAAVLNWGLFRSGLSMSWLFNVWNYQKLMAIPFVAVAGWIFDLLLFPPVSVVLTLCYLKFTQEIPYPALIKKQTPDFPFTDTRVGSTDSKR